MTATITDLGVLGTSSFWPVPNSATAINAAGQVVGVSNTSFDGQSTAFLWQKGALTALGTVGPTDTSDGGEATPLSVAYAINGGGEVVGESNTAITAFTGAQYATVWQHGTVTHLPTLGGGGDAAYGVNDPGQIVGQSNGRAVLWSNGGVTDLSPGLVTGTGSVPGAETVFNISIAHGINNLGQIVGQTSASFPVPHATLWQNGATTDLGIGEALAINGKGVIVGDDGFSAVEWNNGVETVLPSLISGGKGTAEAINDAGMVVGKAKIAVSQPVLATHQYDAVLWDKGTVTDLNSLLPANSGWILTDATGINGNGQIVGTGLHNFVNSSFLLSLNGNTVIAGNSAAGVCQTYFAGELAGPANVIDTAANVSASLDNLETVAAAHDLGSITLSDGGTPTLTVTAMQLAKDALALKAITGSHSVSVSGVSPEVGSFILDQNAIRLANGNTLDMAGVSGQSGTNSVVGWQSAALPTFAHGWQGGNNVVLLTGAKNHYALQIDAAGSMTVKDIASGDATFGQSITVTGARDIVFDGGSTTSPGVFSEVMMIASGGDATLARLYQATFGRMPDPTGLESWQGQLDSGSMTLQQISQSFVNSAEFVSRVGANTTDQQFVEALYTNVLGRTADPAGAVGYTAYLGSIEPAMGVTVARGFLLLTFAGSQEEAGNSASWLVDPTTGGYASPGDLMPAATVVGQAVGNQSLNTGLIDPASITATLSNSAFQLVPSAGSGATLTVLAGAPAETVLLSSAVPDLVLQNAGDTVFAGSSASAITLAGGANATITLGGGHAQISVLGGVNTTVVNFAAGGGSGVEVANTTNAQTLVLVTGSQTAVNGAALSFATGNYVVSIGNIGAGTAAEVAAAANKAYLVADVAGEHVTFMGQDGAGNTEFWFFGSTGGIANGTIPAASLAHSADVNGNHHVDVPELVHVATLVGVTATSLTAADLV